MTYYFSSSLRHEDPDLLKTSVKGAITGDSGDADDSPDASKDKINRW